jgi:hypothetical protein
MTTARCTILLAALLPLAPAAARAADVPGDIPAALAVPDGQKLTFEALGEGVQIYACSASAAGQLSWTFVAPEATLYGLDDGEVVGTHFAGPTWEANNGGWVKGTAIARATVDTTAIPWLLLQAIAHDGPGLFSQVSYVQRLDTTGGTAPTTGCDAAHLGDRARVPYTAHYLFYKPHDAGH